MKPTSVHRTRFERGLCAAGALVCYAAAVILAPSGARSQLAPAAVAVSSAPERVTDAPIEPVAPARDAFAPRIAGAVDAPPPPRQLLPSPPPLGARAVPPPARVTAIVTGEAPSAIVEIDGEPHAVGIGDHIAGARIIAINATAIDLDNGTQLQLAPVAP